MLTDEVVRALTFDSSSTAADHTVDITTIGARTGLPCRIEIWLHQIEGRWYLSSVPGRTSWHRNLLVNPHLTVHLKHRVSADLAATAIPVKDPAQRRAVLEPVVAELNHRQGAATRPHRVDDWVSASPVIELIFDDLRRA